MNSKESSASVSTWGKLAKLIGWLALLALCLVTAAHGISITLAWTGLDPIGGGAIAILAILGVALVEIFSALTAVLFAAHVLRDAQKPVGMMIEGLWVLFAALNLISSFAIKHGEAIPQFVGYWVSWGLPISGLISGVLFYFAVYRLDPKARRAEAEAEAAEKLDDLNHQAEMEVLESEAVTLIVRQATWLQLPQKIGNKLNLSADQVKQLQDLAPRMSPGHSEPAPDPVKKAIPKKSSLFAARDRSRRETTITVPLDPKPKAPPISTVSSGDSGPERARDRRSRRQSPPST